MFYKESKVRPKVLDLLNKYPEKSRIILKSMSEADIFLKSLRSMALTE